MLLVLFSFHGNAQEKTDSTQVIDTTVVKHSPKKAAIMSAVLPGLGQVYNKKYWKVPIVYASMGTLIYFIIDYNKNYHIFVNGYNDYIDKDPNTNSFENISRIRQYSDKSGALKYYKDFYRRWRDLDFLILAGVYALNIIDANVDAHFFHFDVGDDLTFRIKPVIFEPTKYSSKLGFSLSLNF